MRIILITLIISSFLFSCSDGKRKLTPEELTQLQIDSLKNMAQEGDLVTRWNDNIVSYHVRNLNMRDRSFSHAGVVVIKDGQKYICNVDANEKDLDTVRYDRIDSFINPKENFHCALFRFDLSEQERQTFIKEINGYHERKAHFDRVYRLETDSLVYCSEMIAKSLQRATNNRYTFEEAMIPRPMLMLVRKFLERDMEAKEVDEKKFIPVDALYLDTHAKELMRFKLKHFPGEENDGKK